MWHRIRALIRKEFLTILKDKRSRAVILVLPFFQLLVFPYAATLDVTAVRMAVLNQDAGTQGRELVARFTGASAFRVVATLTGQAQIAPTIDAGRADVVLHLGPDFSRELLRGDTPKLQLIVDGRNSNTASIVLDYASHILAAYTEERAGLPPAHLVERAWFNPNLLTLWSILPGILAMITLVATLSITAFSVAREKEVGTFQQLLVTPLRPWEIVLGKTVPALLIGLGESVIIISTSVLWYGLPLVGSLPVLYAGLFLFLLSSIGIGLMVSSLSRTQQQAMLGGFFFIVPTVILSGFATPIANMPHWVQVITYFNPMRYFLVISRGVFMKDLPLDVSLHQLWPMLLIAAGTLTVAGALFRRRIY